MSDAGSDDSEYEVISVTPEAEPQRKKIRNAARYAAEYGLELVISSERHKRPEYRFYDGVRLVEVWPCPLPERRRGGVA